MQLAQRGSHWVRNLGKEFDARSVGPASASTSDIIR